MIKLVRRVLLTTIAIIVLEVIIKVFEVPSYILPLPTEVLQSLYENASLLGHSFAITLGEATLGFVIANIVSITLALFVHFYPKIENYVISFGVFVKTVPIIALTPLLIIWLGSGMASKVATAALICFFPALVSMTQGMKDLDQNYGDLFRLYNASKRNVVRYLLIPGSRPFLMASLKISSSLAVVGALIGEFIGASQGLGFVIITSYYNFDTPLVFAAILLSSVLGLGFYYSLELVDKKTRLL